MSELPDVQQNNEQILNDIQSLQKMEQELFNSLESNPNLSSADQQQIIDKMNQLSNMRINLYQTLSGLNTYFESALNTSVDTLKEQVIAIGIVEDELNRAKKRLQILEEERNNKIRLVEINSYYGDKYAEHSKLMKIIIFTLIPIIVLTFLNNKSILPSTIYYILIVIISIIGAYFFWKNYSSIIMRDNMNYQEYNWGYNLNSLPSGSSTSTDPWASTNVNLGTCLGDSCCSDGLVYDNTVNQCVIPPSTVPPSTTQTTTATTNASNTTENFVANVLSKTQPGKFKSDYNLNGLSAFNT